MAQSEQQQDFGGSMAKMMNSSFLSCGIGMGSKLGLFEKMDEFGKPITSQELADLSDKRERYVREWLALMASGSILDFDDTTKRFSISEHKKPFLTVKGGHPELMVMMESIPFVVAVSSDIEKCFEKDGPRGMTYEPYTGFHEWKNRHTTNTYTWPKLLNIIKLMPGIYEKLQSGITVCEAGCGIGHQLLLIAKHFPNSTFLGFDFDDEAIEIASAHAKQNGGDNIKFVVQDGCHMPPDWSDSYDLLIVFDVVHDVPYSTKFVQEIYRSLKPGGVFYMLEIKASTELKGNISNPDLPMAPSMFGFSLYHCMPVSLYYENGEGLGTCWGTEKQRQYLEQAGFVDIQLLDIKDAVQNHYVGVKPSP